MGVNQPKRLENARILIANTAMDTDKIKMFGSKVSKGHIHTCRCNLTFPMEQKFLHVTCHRPLVLKARHLSGSPLVLKAIGTYM